MAFTKPSNFIWIAIHFASILLFFYGFFSVDEKFTKPSTINQFFDQNSLKIISHLNDHCNPILDKPIFNKMIFIVIDALRSDFIPPDDSTKPADWSSSTMPFLSQLLSTSAAIKFSSQAQSPTVTMPRIKAILAGIKPNFLDVIKNLNSAAFNEDNLIDRAKDKGKRMIFFGDDTWLRMFPGSTFIRHNVTYSFFATDYIQVDTNVTDNMKPELDKLDQWDYMFLHYLGVDHIGHSFGSKSSLMPSKLREMDNAIETIYNKVSAQSEPYLIVVTGDHGMTEEGNHGGSSRPETQTALVFIDTKRKQAPQQQKFTVQQIDIVSTLSVLLGLPIPIKSSGMLINELFSHLSIPVDRVACYLFANSMQVKNLMKFSQLTVNKLTKALEYHRLTYDAEKQKSAANEYIEFLKNAQNEIFGDQDERSFFGLLMQLIAIGLTFLSGFSILRNELMDRSSPILRCNYKEPLLLFAVFVYIARIFSLGSTDFIEDEQVYWPFMGLAIVILNFVRLLTVQKGLQNLTNFMSLNLAYVAKIFGHIAALIILLCIISWPNYFANEINDLLKVNRNYAAAIIMVSLMSISFLATDSRFSKQKCVLISGLYWVYLYRCDIHYLTSFRLPFFNLIPRVSSLFKARLVYLHLIIILMENFFKRYRMEFGWSFVDDLLPQNSRRRNQGSPPSLLRTFTACWVILICLLSKLSNIPLITLSIGLEKIIYNITKWSLTGQSFIFFVITYYITGMACYYGQGNTNGIATIDVAAGYVGLDSYLPMFTGILMTSNTYAHLVFWILMMFVRLTETKSSLNQISKIKVLTSVFSLLLAGQFLTVGYFKIVALILRNHLFIWSVISPKLLYEAFQSFVIFMITVMVTICVQLNGKK